MAKLKADLEATVKRNIKKWLNSHGHYHFSPAANGFGTHGVPDIVVCVGGRFVGLECKAPGKELNTTANQKDHLHRITASGGTAVVVSSLDQVIEIIERIEYD